MPALNESPASIQAYEFATMLLKNYTEFYLHSLEAEEGAREGGTADTLPEKLEQTFGEILTKWT